MRMRRVLEMCSSMLHGRAQSPSFSCAPSRTHNASSCHNGTEFDWRHLTFNMRARADGGASFMASRMGPAKEGHHPSPSTTCQPNGDGSTWWSRAERRGKSAAVVGMGPIRRPSLLHRCSKPAVCIASRMSATSPPVNQKLSTKNVVPEAMEANLPPIFVAEREVL